MEMESSKGRKESEVKQMDWFVFLPDDILLDILKRVPDVFLRYKAKYVCTRWFNIITNRILLDHHSFILVNKRTLTTRLVDIREEEEGLQVIKKQDLDIPHEGTIRSWCNEFLLISDSYSRNSLYVYNQLTKEISHLPLCDASCEGHNGYKSGVALYFDKFKGIYKVIHLYIGPPIQCEVLVLRTGILAPLLSNWKKIQAPHINELGEYFDGDPVLVDGRYLHWDVTSSDYLISMDVVKEEIFQTKLPGSGIYWKFVGSSFVMGRNLAKIEKVCSEKAEIWILKDFEKEKWEKLQLVTFKETGRYPGQRYPVCGVISKRYIVLESIPSTLFSYRLKDGVVKELGQIESYDRPMVLSSAPSFI